MITLPAKSKLSITVFCIVLIVWIWSAIKPLNPAAWFLENVMVVALGIFYWFKPASWKLSDFSIVMMGLFLCLHIYASHYAYSNVPFGEYFSDLLGIDRNSYDRIVHFSFGFLMGFPILDIVKRYSKSFLFAVCCTILIILGLSAILEINEWFVHMWMSPALSGQYIALQGDAWDAQHDMFIAGLGSLVLFVHYGLSKWVRRKSEMV